MNILKSIISLETVRDSWDVNEVIPYLTDITTNVNIYLELRGFDMGKSAGY